MAEIKSKSVKKDKIVCDTIFGFITLKPYITAIIDTPEFQRLRGIWQLGVTSFVYPTAHHSRFEHCIGTYWQASKIIRKIQEQLRNENSKIQITDNEVICVEIAALCHDIGHGPFSHFWDLKVLPRFCSSHTMHENQFEEMWTILKEKNEKVRNMIKIYEISKEDEILISKLVKGEVDPDKNVLFGIVNNPDSGIDVDKWDYLARDSMYLGHSSTNYRIDVERMLHLVRAIEDSDGKWKLAFRETEALNLIRVFQLRHYMHQTAYKHRTSIAIEQMMLDGIEKCFEKDILFKDQIGTAEWILKNTDAIFWSNIYEINEFKQILSRRFYKPICEAVKYKIESDPTIDLKNYLNLKYNDDSKNIRYGFYQFQLGNKNSNPMLNIPFYKKRNDNEIFKFNKETLPSYLNINCDETRIIIFLTSIDDLTYANNIKSYLKEYLMDQQWQVSIIPS